MDEKELKKYDVIIVDEDIILSSIATNQCTVEIATLQEILRLTEKEKPKNGSVSNPEYTPYYALAMKIKRLFKCISHQQRLFKMDAFEWDTDTDEFPPDLKKIKHKE